MCSCMNMVYLYSGLTLFNQTLRGGEGSECQGGHLIGQFTWGGVRNCL